MKLLLTSAGITNKSLADELKQLLGREPSEVRIAFIPTAAIVEPGNKDWYLQQIDNLREYGFLWIDFVDVSAKEFNWLARMAGIDCIFVSGGNTFYLLDQFRKSGFGDWLIKQNDSLVYVGVSAGSIIATPKINIASIEPADPNYPNIEDLTGLGLVNFEIEPHCDERRFDVVAEYSKNSNSKVYALDDDSAVAVNDGMYKIISEGVVKLFKNGTEIKNE